MDKVSLVIPVGPSEANQRWLPEALESVKKQTILPAEVLLIDDMAGLDNKILDLLEPEFKFNVKHTTEMGFKCLTSEDGIYATNAQIWRSPWLLGVAHAFNFGVALARNELVFMLGSDDYLEPTCIEKCIGRWKENKQKDGYYFVGLRYLDGREFPLQDVPCNAAMVTKGLWRKTGGFAVESAVGTPDANFISQMLVHDSKSLVKVADGEPLYNYRVHSDTETGKKYAWQGIILATRDLLTQTWQEPNWGRTI